MNGCEGYLLRTDEATGLEIYLHVIETAQLGVIPVFAIAAELAILEPPRIEIIFLVGVLPFEHGARFGQLIQP